MSEALLRDIPPISTKPPMPDKREAARLKLEQEITNYEKLVDQLIEEVFTENDYLNDIVEQKLKNTFKGNLFRQNYRQLPPAGLKEVIAELAKQRMLQPESRIAEQEEINLLATRFNLELAAQAEAQRLSQTKTFNNQPEISSTTPTDLDQPKPWYKKIFG